MATVNLNLYPRYQAGDPLDGSHNRFLYNQLGGTPAIPALNSGDTLAISEYFLDQGNGGTIPFRGHRYAGSTVVARLRAVGNDTTYATATASAEIAPSSSAPTITHSQNGVSYSLAEKQRIQFASPTFTGSFTLTFPGALHTSGTDGVVSPKGTTVAIPITSGIAGIQAAIRALPLWYGKNVAVTKWDSSIIVVTGTVDDFTVNYFNATTVSGEGAGPVPLCTINASDIQYAFGWTISLVLDGNGHTFTDLFLADNGPAYFETVLDGIVAARFLLTSSGGSGGTPPPVDPGNTTPGTGGTGSITGQIGDVRYDGEFGTPFPVGDYRISRPIERDNDCYLIRQAFRIYRPNYSPPAVGAFGPSIYNRQSYFLRDSEPVDLRVGLICEFERTWVTVPNARVEYGKSSKNFKFLNPTYYYDVLHPNGILTQDSLASYSNPVPVKIFFNYSIGGDATNFPTVPDILFISVLNGQYSQIVGLGGLSISKGQGGNFGFTFIDGDINPWMGNIYERKLIYALQ